MRILIESKNLIDFPYDKEHEHMFQMDDTKINNLVSEILYASSTCYLVSGYRGAGKTSFIKKVQTKCNDEIDKKNKEEKDIKKVLFIYSSFSKYENQTNFLRKIIRDLEETLRNNKNNTEDPSLKKEAEELKRKTFYAIEDEFSETTEKEKINEFSLDFNDFLLRLLKAVAPALIPLLSEFIFSLPVFPSFDSKMLWAKWLVYLGLGTWGIIKTLKFAKKYSIKNLELKRKSEKSITDDDIINYSLERLIDKFNEQNFKLVFVLDELDKVDEEDFDSLLKEMKPWLVRGKADFIVVAGQKLTMKYYQLRDRDDEILASLFSKIIHINLLQEYNFEKLFNDFLCKAVIVNEKDNSQPLAFNELPEIEKEKMVDLRSSYVYRCKRLPRTFFNLIRQDIQWNNDEAYIIYNKGGYNTEKIKLKSLKKIFDTISIDGDLSETIKDHFIMQLFFIASTIELKSVPNKIAFEDFIEPLIKDKSKEDKQKYEYKNLLPKLNKYLEDFYYAARSEGLIEFDDNTKEQRNSIKQNDFQIGVTQEEKEAEERTLMYDAEKADLDKFKKEFLDFFDELRYFHKNLFTDKKIENINSMTFSNLISDFKNIFYFPNESTPLFEKDYSFYESRNDKNEPFIEMKKYISDHKFNFSSAYNSLLREYVYQSAKKGLPRSIRWMVDKELKTSEREYANYKALYRDTSNNEIPIFYRYQYIDGSAKITQEEINRGIDFLDEMNIENQKGCYLIHIIFQTNHNEDYQLKELNTSLMVKNIREDLANKIFYIILPRSSFTDLIRELEKINPKIISYKINPTLDYEKAKANTRKNLSKKVDSNSFDPDDPNKGKFGKNNTSGDKILSAKVIPESSGSELYYLSLFVSSTNSNKPLTGKVTFYLHPTFNPEKITVLAKNGVAEINNLLTYEAFTVGATCDNNSTKLELDLNTLDNVPEGFKY